MTEHYSDLDNLLGAYFPGDFSFDEEINELVTELEKDHLERFLSQAHAVLSDGEAADALVRRNVNWRFGSERDTLMEIIRRVEAARGR